MTSSAYDPRPGQDDTIGGDAREREDAGKHQRWAGMDGAVAWHLIDRHADDWSGVAEMMHAWLQANGGHIPQGANTSLHPSAPRRSANDHQARSESAD